MLRISDPTASLKFYNDFLGLHTIFIFNTGAWTIYYLGPRSVSIADLGTAQGLLELYYMPSKEGDERPKYRNGNEQDGLGMGFGHLGFTVPDVEGALERAREMGIKILKPLGDDRAETMGVEGLGKGESVVEGYKFVFRQLVFVSDPDVSVFLFSIEVGEEKQEERGKRKAWSGRDCLMC